MRQSDLHGDMESTAEMTVPRETDEATLEAQAAMFHGATTNERS
jgi:hypothetical protein